MSLQDDMLRLKITGFCSKSIKYLPLKDERSKTLTTRGKDMLTSTGRTQLRKTSQISSKTTKLVIKKSITKFSLQVTTIASIICFKNLSTPISRKQTQKNQNGATLITNKFNILKKMRSMRTKQNLESKGKHQKLQNLRK